MKILVTTMPMWGHVHPMIPIVVEMLNHSHQVEWFIDGKFHRKLKEYNIPTIQASNCFQYTPIDLNLFNCIRNARHLIKQAKEVLVDWSLDQHDKIIKIIQREKYDAILTDCIFIGSLMAALQEKIPCFVLGVIPYPGYCRETGPYGCGWRTSQNKLRILFYQLARYFAYYFLMRPVYNYAGKKFNKAGFDFEFKKGHFADFIIQQCQLYLQSSLSDFEYNFGALPENVRIIGPSVLDECERGFDMQDAMIGKPLIFVSQGTVQNNDVSQLILPCCEALKDLDVYLVVSLNGHKRIKEFEKYKHIDMRESVEYSCILPKTSIFITNGGYGGVNLALKHGVPIIVAGRSDDKGEVGARVERSGVGINLRTSRPTANSIRRAVEKINNNPSFRKRALELQEKIQINNSARNARLHIEKYFAN